MDVTVGGSDGAETGLVVSVAPTTLAPAGLAPSPRLVELGPGAESRQQQQVLSVAYSAERRIAQYGKARLNPGYDPEDPFICDDVIEPLQPGAPCLIIGTGTVVAHLGEYQQDVRGEAVCRTRALGGGRVTLIP